MGKVSFATIPQEHLKLRRSRLLSKPTFLLTSLLVFLVAYNFVPQVHEKVQSFLTVQHWEVPVPWISLKQGTFKGKLLDDRNYQVRIEAFLGIPYALPPVGKRRFAKPVPVLESNQTFDATEYSPRCPGKQYPKIPGTPQLESGEDCLTANVFRWRHTFSHRAKLPVFVYVHGGALDGGYTAMHDTASMLAWSEEPYLAISFNYRVGALGFLNSELAAKDGLLNVGLHDRKMLLEWVRKNAAAFGGNPNDVTVAGLSADTISIGHHILDANEKRQLFHKAIIESDALTSRAVQTPGSKLHKEQFEKFVTAVGCAGRPEFEIMNCLRVAPLERVVAAQTLVFDEYNSFVNRVWQPVVDGDMVSHTTLDAWKSGDWHQIPILTGFNRDEGASDVPKDMEDSAEFTKFFSNLVPQLSKSDLRHLNKLYPDPSTNSSSQYLDSRNVTAMGIGSQYKRLKAAYAQYSSVCPVRQFASFVATVQESPVWLYHWAVNKTVLASANHGDQIPYETMLPLVKDIPPTHDTIARQFNSYVTSFVVTGDPNRLKGRKAIKRPEWRVFGQGRKTLIFGGKTDETAEGDSAGDVARLEEDIWAQEECNFWWQKFETLEG